MSTDIVSGLYHFSGTPRLSSRLKQVSFDDGSRDKPRSGSGLSSPSYDTVAPKMRPRRNTDRIMRDYRLSTIDVQALKCLMEKVNLYDDKVRDTVLPLLKEGSVSSDSALDTETLSDKVVTDAEKENLKEKLFLSRKELDSYISFCKKMEREKRQTLSEKEDLVTKTQWLDKRMNLIESENKALKIERADLLNQVYRLRYSIVLYLPLIFALSLLLRFTSKCAVIVKVGMTNLQNVIFAFVCL